MDEQLLQDLFDLTTEGAFSSFEEFKSFIETDGENAFNDIYELTIDGAFGSQDEYNTFVSPLKKKDSSQSTVISPQENTELPSPTETTPVSSELPGQAEEINISGVNAPGAEPEGQEEIDEIILDTQTSDEGITEINLSGERYGKNIESGEDKFWFEEMLGNVPVVGEVTDFFGDMIRAGEQGFAQGGTIDDAMSVFAQGSSMSNEDMAQYIAAVKKMDSMPMSDEMKSFNKIYKNNGGGILGFILGVGANPTVTGQLLVSSIASMVNPTVLGGGAVGAGLGAGAGAAAGSVGGPLAIFTAAGGGIAGGLMGMGSTLEFGLSYTEFLREEITKKGLKFDQEGIRKILNDPEAVQSIRNRAAARGLVIGAVDGLTAGVAGKVGASLTKAGIAAGKSAVKAGGKGALATTAIEAAGGAGGEAAARAVTGQEMDVAEIGFEGITGQASGVLTIPQAAFGMSSTDVIKKGYNEGMNIFKPPVYKIGKDKMTKAEIEKFVDTATLEEAETIQFDVKNDPVLEQKIKNLKVKAENNKTLNPKIQGEDRVKILDLEVQLANLGNLEMESTKIEAQKIKSEIKEITERALSSDTKVEPTKKDLELAKEQLISEGIIEPSPEQIKTKANAIQEPSTEAVDVQEQTSDGKTLGERDTTGAVTNQSQKETEGQTQNKETEVAATLVADQQNVREDISKPYIAGNTEVKFNPDGTVKEILKKGTKTPASKVAKSKAEKNVLKNRIDVNAGKIFTPSNDSKITPEQYSQEVSDNSTNIRQIAETIKNDTKKYRSLDKKEQLQMLDPSDILSIKISEQDFNRYGDSNLITPEIRKNWFKKPDKSGNIINDLDTVVMETPGLEVENVIDFIVNNPKRKINVKQGKPSVVRELETKFKELTGINPTPTNINTVVNISPDAQPLAVIKEKDKASLEIAEEPTKNKKGVKNPKKILGDKPKKVTVNEKVALKDQIKLEAKAAREAAREAKRSIIKEQELKRKRKIAKKNIGAKLGVISADLDTALQTLFSIDPDLIPDKQLDSYADLVKEFGDSKRVLDLNEKSNTLDKALDIINAVEMEVEVDEDGVLVKEEKVDDYDLNQEAKEIQANKITNEELNNIPDERSREIAREINQFSKQDIDGLVKENKKGEKNYGLVNTLKAVKNNIRNGFVPKAALDVLIEVNSNKAENKVTPVVEKVTKPGIYRHLRSFYNSAKVAITSKSPSGKNLLLDRLRSSPTFFIDDIFGNFNSKTIYNNTFKKLSDAYSSFETEVSRAENKIKDADKLLRSKSRNKTVKAKYKLRILQLQREYLSNIIDGKPNPKAPPALDFIDATMEAIKDGDALSPYDLKILQELRSEFLVDNEISLDKLNKSLSTKEKQALALYDEVSASTAEKAVFISSTLYGNRVNLLNDYTHHSVITKSDIKAEFDKKTDKFVNSTNNTKAGTIVERTPGAKPISFDPSYSALRGVQETLLDYNMTQVNREVAKTVNKIKSEIKSDPNSTMAQNNAANALVKSLNEVNEVLFGNTFTDVSAGGVLLNKIKTLGYQASLASIPRAVAELAGNMGMMLKNPVASARAFKDFGGLVLNPKNTTLGIDIMDNLNSSETSKLFDTENMQSKYSNMTDFMQTSQASGSAVGSVQNAMGIIMNLGINQTAAGINTMANKLMSYPDQAISRPLWFGSFADSFAKATKELNGKEVKLTVEDYKKIGDGTSQYLTPEFKEAREIAKNAADANAITVATSTNPYNTILKNMPRKDGNNLNALYRQANSYMARFSLFEYGTARNAIGALYKSGDISRTQAVGLLSGVIFRMSSYVAVYSVLSSIMDEELFDAKDDKEEDIEDILTRQTVGSVLTLLTRGNLGNIPSIPINFMLESMINEPYLGDLRNNEEYDPYKHSIVFSQLNKEDLQKKNLAEIGMKIFAGPYGPMLATALRTGKLAIRSQFNKTQESRDKNLEELTNRMSFEALGNSGLIPFYKDIRRALVKKRFNKPKPLTKTQLKELKKNYPEYFEDSGTKTSAGSRKSRTQSKGSGRRTRRQSRQ